MSIIKYLQIKKKVLTNYRASETVTIANGNEMGIITSENGLVVSTYAKIICMLYDMAIPLLD